MVFPSREGSNLLINSTKLVELCLQKLLRRLILDEDGVLRLCHHLSLRLASAWCFRLRLSDGCGGVRVTSCQGILLVAQIVKIRGGLLLPLGGWLGCC